MFYPAGYEYCSTDVLGLADSMCSGLQTCEIRVPNALLDQTQPCNKELKTYLEVDYGCVAGNNYTLISCLLFNSF